MKRGIESLKMAIEEEYQIVDRATGKLRPDCSTILDTLGKTHVDGAEIQHELHLTQIEMASPVCEDLADVRSCLRNVRGRLIDAARQHDAELVAAGTHPFGPFDSDDVTPKERYRNMSFQYQRIAHDLVIFGCHVHIDIPDPELGVQVMNRVVPWLPALQALSANSPFWEGTDTGYASYRRELWVQWPMAGPPAWFKDWRDMQRCIARLIQAEAIADATRIYWDVRLPEKTPTIEFRVMDVLTRIDEAVAITGLIRALVHRCLEDLQRGTECQPVRPEIIRVALWQAARYGLTDHLLDPFKALQTPAVDHIRKLMDYVRDPLQQYGDEHEVTNTITRMVDLGGGAARQRELARDHGWDALVRHLAEETARETQHAGKVVAQ